MLGVGTDVPHLTYHRDDVHLSFVLPNLDPKKGIRVHGGGYNEPVVDVIYFVPKDDSVLGLLTAFTYACDYYGDKNG